MLEYISEQMTDVEAAAVLSKRKKSLDAVFDAVEISALERAIRLLCVSCDKGYEKSEIEAQNALIVSVVDFLNETCGTSYKAKSKATQGHIRQRIKEGYTEEDFQDVIRFKASQWKDDPKMSEYLRPNTLFSGKFESYLQNARKLKPKTAHATVDEPEEVEPELTDEEWLNT